MHFETKTLKNQYPKRRAKCPPYWVRGGGGIARGREVYGIPLKESNKPFKRNFFHGQGTN